GIAELGHHQLVLDPGGPGRHVVQAIITHRWSSSVNGIRNLVLPWRLLRSHESPIDPRTLKQKRGSSRIDSCASREITQATFLRGRVMLSTFRQSAGGIGSTQPAGISRARSMARKAVLRAMTPTHEWVKGQPRPA